MLRNILTCAVLTLNLAFAGDASEESDPIAPQSCEVSPEVVFAQGIFLERTQVIEVDMTKLPFGEISWNTAAIEKLMAEFLPGHSCSGECGSLGLRLVKLDSYRIDALKKLLPHVDFLEIRGGYFSYCRTSLENGKVGDPYDFTDSSQTCFIWQKIFMDCLELRGLKFSIAIGISPYQLCESSQYSSGTVFKALEYLDCSGCGMTDDLLKVVMNRAIFPKLRYLDIRGHKITDLYLDRLMPEGGIAIIRGIFVRFK